MIAAFRRAAWRIPRPAPRPRSVRLVEKAQQQIPLRARERQRGPWPRPWHAPRGGPTTPGAIAIHQYTVRLERPTGTAQMPTCGVSSATASITRPRSCRPLRRQPQCHARFFWASMISSAREYGADGRCRAPVAELAVPRHPASAPAFSARVPPRRPRRLACTSSRSSRSRCARVAGTPQSVPASLQRSTSESRRRLSLPENLRRLAIATTSGSRRAASSEAASPVALRGTCDAASQAVPSNPIIEHFSNEVIVMSCLCSKLPETGVSPHSGTGGNERATSY